MTKDREQFMEFNIALSSMFSRWKQEERTYINMVDDPKTHNSVLSCGGKRNILVDMLVNAMMKRSQLADIFASALQKYVEKTMERKSVEANKNMYC